MIEIGTLTPEKKVFQTISYSQTNTTNPALNQFKKGRQSSNLSYLTTNTTKADDNADNKNIKSIPTIHNFHSTKAPLISDDFLFEEFRNKGLIDSDLDAKINDYKTNLSTNSLNNTNSNDNNCNLSLKLEFNILKSSLDNASTQLYNLQSILSLKEKKLDILESGLKKIQERRDKREEEKKIMQLNDAIASVNVNSGGNNFKRNRKTHSVNIENVSQFLSFNNENNISFKINQGLNTEAILNENKSENLKNEVNRIKKQQEEEYKDLREALNKKALLEIKNEKMKFEDKLRELNSDNCFLINSLQMDIEFLKDKSKAKEKNFIDIKFHNEEKEYESLIFNEKRRSLTEKLNYYKSVINNIAKENSLNESECKMNTKNADNSFKEDNKLHSKSLNLFCNNFPHKNHLSSVSSNTDYDINFNTNGDFNTISSKLSNLNIKTMQVNYTLDNMEMRPYPQLTKASKKKITFETKLNNISRSSKNFGNFPKVSKKTNNNINNVVIVNPEDYMSNSILLEVNSIRTFESKFMKK